MLKNPSNIGFQVHLRSFKAYFFNSGPSNFRLFKIGPKPSRKYPQTVPKSSPNHPKSVPKFSLISMFFDIFRKFPNYYYWVVVVLLIPYWIWAYNLTFEPITGLRHYSGWIRLVFYADSCRRFVFWLVRNPFRDHFYPWFQAEELLLLLLLLRPPPYVAAHTNAMLKLSFNFQFCQAMQTVCTYVLYVVFPHVNHPIIHCMGAWRCSAK